MEPERISPLNQHPRRAGTYVLYWMQQAQRTEDNLALDYAVLRANELNQPLAVAFGLTGGYPEATARHYLFLLEGLRDVAAALARRGIPFQLLNAPPDEAIPRAAAGASLVVTDAGYLAIQRQWRARVADQLACQLVQVETDVVVPVTLVSEKAEFAARTIRPKIHRHLDRFLRIPSPPRLHWSGASPRLPAAGPLLDPADPDGALKAIAPAAGLPVTPLFPGGQQAAQACLKKFVKAHLHFYHELRSDPSADHQSHLSPYLHFGQVSPLRVARAVMESKAPQSCRYDFMEELIVRRELSMNFAYYQPRYAEYAAVPDWARATLAEHAADPRPYLYTTDQLEQAATHDPYWNAAQREMVQTGMMHNYMRMYWGKKIIEWTASPEAAFATALYLNNKHALDGRDANSYAGVAWCFGLHDRPWGARPVFGTVRYMSAAGLAHKFDIENYVARVARAG